MKICSKCKQEKDFTCFNRASCNKDGLRSHCIECRKTNYKKNSEKERERARLYRKDKDNKLRALKYQKDYRRNNRDKIKEQRLRYFDKNPLTFFKDRVRKSIQSAFSRRGKIKSLHSEEILGCTMDDFFVYIAS